jgi:hypothetical protein
MPMSMVFLVLVALAQDTGCEAGAAQRALRDASSRVAGFDLGGALSWLGTAATLGCLDIEIRTAYLEGLIAARAAYGLGGSDLSLGPVRRSVARLDAAAGSAPARIAGFVLRAAMAGAQSERDEMALYLEHATALERLQLRAGEPGAPLLSAHEVAGDLWLQVHRYGEAADAYALAAREVGTTPTVRLGLARSAARLRDPATACREYAALIAGRDPDAPEPPEMVEARVFLDREPCEPGAR